MRSGEKALRITAVLMSGLLMLQLFGGGLGKLFSAEQIASFMLFMETGQVIRLQKPEQSDATQPTEPILPEQTITAQQPVQAVFYETDTELVRVNSVCGYDADLSAMLRQPLEWDLTQEAPAVLIIHSHGTESYEKTQQYRESSPYRTLDTGYNVVCIGEEVAKILTRGGVEVIHDRTMYDYPSYNASYSLSRDAVQAYLQQYPTIRMVLDIHRDALESDTGQQLAPVVEASAGTSAQLMMVVGTDAGGLLHPNWSENMALAVKLHAQLEKAVPGICRPISFRTQRFNQDLSPGMLLVEVGAAGNTRQQALLAARYLAEGILALAYGAAGSGDLQ